MMDKKTANRLWLPFRFLAIAGFVFWFSGPATPGADDPPAFPTVDPASAGIDLKALDRLRDKSRETQSDAVVIVRDGRLIADWNFGPRVPVEMMSATKSVVSLAVGRLIELGKIQSIEQPVSDFFPEWRQGRKRQVTLRHLLSQTSGLQDDPKQTVYESPDFVRFALAAELVTDPGTKFSYSNMGVNLLAGIVQKASGMRMDLFIARELFKPLGITEFRWTLDKAGNAHGLAGLEILAIDMAKLGQLVLDEGEWRGRRLLSKDYIRMSTQPSQTLEPTYGLLWWLNGRSPVLVVDDVTVAYFKKHGATPRSLDRLEGLRGKSLETPAFFATLRPIVREDEVLKGKFAALTADPLRATETGAGPIRSVSAVGYLGQYLCILPSSRIVAVRQRQKPPGADLQPEDDRRFSEFWSMVEALATGPAPVRKD